MDLPEAAGTKKSVIALCSAKEIVKLITTEEGILRRNIFDDNVRDFQGYTDINLEMKETIMSNPEQFLLLNNGITVVCSDIDVGNRRVKISSPQIVNGCQTCNVLFECYRNGISIEKAMAVIKFISSDEAGIINNIVRGTNRQNIVYEEAFEITKEFHKSLESFFMSYCIDPFPRIYYERRSKQYESDAKIKPSQKVNFRIIIQSIVGLFLCKIEDSYKHESRLLKEYSNIIFVDKQSFLPYYTASFLYKQVDNLFRQNKLPKSQKAFRLHVAFILMLLLNGRPSNINNSKKSDEYCNAILSKINSMDSFFEKALDASKVFETTVEEWVAQKGETYRSGIKDNSEFTQFLMQRILNESNQRTTGEIKCKKQYRGRILFVRRNSNGQLFGFIRKKPDDIYFNSVDNPTINEKYVGKDVLYEVETIESRQKAVNIEVLE